tara:strand:- start:24362 stop:25210 length:849 start_codon:yes stop_codon:yes gene_type:complete
MKTAHKIALAKLAYTGVHAARAVVGRGDNATVVRNGVKYALDLSEGIDFAIYIGRYEPSTTTALQKLVKPGMTVLDIGANVGVHALLMGSLVGESGRVLAVEPTTFAIGKLRQSLALNPEFAKRVDTAQAFLGPKEATSAPVAVYSSWPLRGGAELHEKHLGQPMATDGVTSISVDALVASKSMGHVDLVKIDVDGFECQVLAGASEVMERDRPIFVMEVSPYVLEERGASLDQFLRFFTSLGYVFFDERNFGPGAPELSVADIARLSRDGASINCVAMVIV